MEPSSVEKPAPSREQEPHLKALPSETRLNRLNRLGYFLDDAIRIPILGYRIGYDALIGLIPGLGDVAGFLLSAYLILEASRFRLPKRILFRMVLNIGLEALLGTLPFLGDLFDATWKANLRNLDLLYDHLSLERPTRPAPERSSSLLTWLLWIVGLASLAGVIYWLVQSV